MSGTKLSADDHCLPTKRSCDIGVDALGLGMVSVCFDGWKAEGGLLGLTTSQTSPCCPDESLLSSWPRPGAEVASR